MKHRIPKFVEEAAKGSFLNTVKGAEAPGYGGVYMLFPTTIVTPNPWGFTVSALEPVDAGTTLLRSRNWAPKGMLSYRYGAKDIPGYDPDSGLIKSSHWTGAPAGIGRLPDRGHLGLRKDAALAAVAEPRGWRSCPQRRRRGRPRLLPAIRPGIRRSGLGPHPPICERGNLMSRLALICSSMSRDRWAGKKESRISRFLAIAFSRMSGLPNSAHSLGDVRSPMHG